MTEIIVYTAETCPKCRDKEVAVSALRLPGVTLRVDPSIRNICSAYTHTIDPNEKTVTIEVIKHKNEI